MAKDKKSKIPFKVLSKKGLMGLAMAGVMVASPFMLAGCSNGQDGKDGAPGKDAPAWHYGVDYNQYNGTINVGDFFIDTNDYILYQKTADSWITVMENYGRPATPVSAPIIEINAEGFWVIDGVQQTVKAKGEDGQPGTTPKVEIKDGFWYINDVKSVKAEGVDGDPGTAPEVTINEDGYWVINDVPQTVKATPSKIEIKNGKWYIDDVESGDAKGKDGNTWTVDTSYPATANNGDMFLNNTTWNVYQYDGTTWVLKGNIKGLDGVGVVETIPSYWKTYLDEKIAEINVKGDLYGANADSFIFITDQHLDGSSDLGAAIINYICENTSINKVIFGGDTLADGVNGNELLREYREQFNNDLMVMGMRGNHDPVANTTENSFYNIMIRPLIDKANVTDELYYSYDNNAQKIRYIVTDSVASKENNLTSDEQIAWMQEQILELESDWTAVIFHHGLWEGTSANTQTLTKSKDGEKIIAAVDAIYDEAECNIAGIYSGHTHRDYYELSSKGYALISTATDCEVSKHSAADINNPTRTPGTITEQTFDIVFVNPTTSNFETIRIGAGDDRVLSYNKKSVDNKENITSQFFNTGAENNGWFKGAINYTTGELDATTLTNENDWLASDFVDISKYESITFSHIQVGNTKTTNGYAFYDENKTYIQGFTNGLGVAQVKDVKVMIPTNAKYVRISWMSSGHGSYNEAIHSQDKFYCYGTIPNPNEVNLTAQFTWTPGAVLHETGETNTDEAITKDWIYSDFVDISAYDSITFNLVTVNTTDSPRGFALYDENKQRIYGETNGKGQGVTDINIPTNGAKYIRITWMNEGHSRYNTENGIYHIENFYCIGKIDSDIAE